MNKQATPSQASAAPVWFITGCSTGFGLELARQAIERGYSPSKACPRPCGEAVARGADFPKATA